MNQIERRFTAQSEKIQLRVDDSEEKRKINGYAAVFYDGTPETEYELWDDTVERIAPGAFNGVISESDCRCLFNHESCKVIGRTKSGTCRLSVDAAGLAYENDMPDSTCGNDVFVAIKRGDITGSSFAFIPSKVMWSQEDRDGKRIDVRTIMEISRLLDVGPVTYPAYEGTSAAVRSKEALIKEREAMKQEETPTVPDYETELRKRDLEIKSKLHVI